MEIRNIIAVYAEKHTKRTTTLCWQNAVLLDAEAEIAVLKERIFLHVNIAETHSM